jgi:EmrB/QacA subfamily drug resistance transporter
MADLRAPAAPDRLDREIWTLTGVVVLGAIMTLLDATAVNVAFGVLRADLGASLAAAQWVLTSYLLTMAMVVPVIGWAIDRFGARRLWIFSLGVFVTGSLCCGLSWSVGALIAARVLQGVGGGMIVPLAQTILATAAGPRRLGRAMSLLSVITVLGPVLGPFVGGALVEYASWRWVFFVNLPIGVVAIAVALRHLPRGGPPRPSTLDLRGLALASVGIVALTYGLAQASSRGDFATDDVTLAIGGGAGLLVLFAVHARRRGRVALIDLNLFTNRDFSIAAGCLFAMSAALFAVQLVLPMFYQLALGYGPLEAGLLLAPQGIGVALAVPFAGRLTDRVGPRVAVLPGLALMVLGIVSYTRFTADSSPLIMALALVGQGAGIGFVMPSVTAAAYASLAAEAVPRASSATTMLRQIGGSAGTALIAVVLAHGFASTTKEAAFVIAFWTGLALTGLSVLPALFLRRVTLARAGTATPGSRPSPRPR